MRFALRLFLLSPLAAILACAAGTSSASTAYDLSGNWEADATIVTNLAPTKFAGALQVTSGSISGTLNTSILFPTSIITTDGETGCAVDTLTAVAVTGTINSSGDLTLTVPFGASNGTATITATIGNPQTPTTGSYQIVGGPCATPPTAITITQYAPVAGTYTGVLASGTETVPATVTFTQSSTPDATGEFPLSGTITLNGTCSLGTIFGAGSVRGSLISASTPYPGNTQFYGTINPAASTIAAIYYVYGTSDGCGATFQGTLTRQ